MANITKEYESDPDFQKMTAKQRIFALAYLRTLSVKLSYAETIDGVGDIDNTYFSNKYINNPRVRAFLGRHLKLREKRMEELADETLEELASILAFDPATLIGEDGNLLPINKLPKEAKSAITEVYVSSNGKISYKFGGKTEAIKALSKLLELYLTPAPPEPQKAMTEDEKFEEIQRILSRAKDNA